MGKREFIKIGYKAFNGYIFTPYDCKRYNFIQERINAFIKVNMPTPETLLNDSSMTFKQIIGVC